MPIDIKKLLQKHKDDTESLKSTLTQSGSIVNAEDVGNLDDVSDQEKKPKPKGAEGITILTVPRVKHKSKHRNKPAPFNRNALEKISERPEYVPDDTTVRKKDKSTVPVLRTESVGLSVTLDDVLKSGKARKSPPSSSVGGVLGRSQRNDESPSEPISNPPLKPKDIICEGLLARYELTLLEDREEWIADQERKLLSERRRDNIEFYSDSDRASSFKKDWLIENMEKRERERDKKLNFLKFLASQPLSFKSVFETKENGSASAGSSVVPYPLLLHSIEEAEEEYRQSDIQYYAFVTQITDGVGFTKLDKTDPEYIKVLAYLNLKKETVENLYEQEVMSGKSPYTSTKLFSRSREKEEKRKEEKQKEKQKDKVYTDDEISQLTAKAAANLNSMEICLKKLMKSGKNPLEARKDPEYGVFKKQYTLSSKELETAKKSRRKPRS
ncbi:MAG: hypothetical protein KFW09_05815 [Oscillospiraceae bacterium]|nr:hypothetical protein [Oscillospiraceae bacterium]